MKKKPHPIVKAVRLLAISLFMTILVTVFVCLAVWSVSKQKPQDEVSYNDNVQLNNIEQYHLSQGHSIKFVEDIF